MTKVAFQSTDIGTIRFLYSNAIYQFTQAIFSNQTQDGDLNLLDNVVPLCAGLASYITERDPDFQKEWKAIQADRRKATYQTGEESTQDAGFRWREFEALTRSMSRIGGLVGHASASAEWKPVVQA